MIDYLLGLKLVVTALAISLVMKFFVDGAGALIDQPDRVIAQQVAPKSSITEEQAAILAGADPSRVLEAAGAGGAKDLPTGQAQCATGTLQIDDPKWLNLNGTAYVSSSYQGQRFYQTLTFPPTFFVQDTNRHVTATVIDKLPDQALLAMERQLAELNLCESKPVYIARFSL